MVHGMSNTSQGPGWWLASDGRWYPPELWTGPPTPYAPTGHVSQRKTNGLAIAALICGCAGFILFIPGVLAIIFGFIARGQIRRSNGQQTGDGMAIAGIIVGFGWVAFLVLAIALGAAHSNSGNSGVVNPAILLGQLGVGPPDHVGQQTTRPT